MTSNYKDDQKWNENKKMEGDDSLRTLECLRGRLLAERQASRVAKLEAQFLGDKLVGLENKLREETKLRQKAEKKIKFLIKKLQSLKISPIFQLDQLSSCSEISGFSCSSSSTDPQESPSKSQIWKDSKADSQSCSNSEEAQESENGENVDNSLALVPVSMTANAKAIEIVKVKNSVSEVLDELRRAREKIQSSMERRRHMNMIRVGPI